MIFDRFFTILEIVDSFFWSYIGFTLVVACGIYFTIKTKGFQFRTLGKLSHTVKELHHSSKGQDHGTHPLLLYFASVGGMVGLGNMVGVITALIIGGPGALFWLWIASFSGMLIKYAEIYLGVRFRVKNKNNGFDGGPMHYLQQAFKGRWLPFVVSILLMIYGVEVYQFLIITDTLSTTFAFNRPLVIGLLLVAIFYTGLGGIKRLATVCTWVMPAFIILYVSMCLWVIALNITQIPEVLMIILKSAFTGHAPLGGFVGSTLMLAAQQGIARAVYSGDIGIGYDAIINSETKTPHPEKQARLAIFSLATDTLICSMSILVVLITGLWKTTESLQPSQYVGAALGQHFPYIEYFIAIFFFLAGYTTIIAFFTVGIKSAKFVSPTWGPKIYFAYAIAAFIFFSFFDQSKVILIMSISGGLLMMINLLGILKLRHHIEFK